MMAQDAAAKDRLREYLRQLPADARAKLASRFEGAQNDSLDGAIANFVLRELKACDSPSIQDADIPPVDPAHHLFKFLDPFLTDRGKGASSPGRFDRKALPTIWRLIASDLLPEEASAFANDLAKAEHEGQFGKSDSLCRKFQARIADALGAALSGDGPAGRQISRLGPEFTHDLTSLRALFKNREALDALQTRLPSLVKNLNADQAAAILRALNVPSLQSPILLPFALTLVVARLEIPLHLVRIAIVAAESDDVSKIVATPYGIAIAIALDALRSDVDQLRENLHRGLVTDIRLQLKRIHDGIRGLRTELDIRADTPYGRQLSSVRSEISGFIQSELESATGRVRRLLRAPREGEAPARIDDIDVKETAQLVELVKICRDYAGELALNEVSLRTYSDLHKYLETASNALVDRMRVVRPQEFDFLRQQLSALLQFCQIMFGPEYAATLGKAADVALHAERKSPRK